MVSFELGDWFRGLFYSAGASALGFMGGAGIQVAAEVSGVSSVASVPVTALTPLFTFLSAVIGLAYGLQEEEHE